MEPTKSTHRKRTNIIIILSLFLTSIMTAQDPMGFHIGAGQDVLFGSDLVTEGGKVMWLSSKNAFRAGQLEQNLSYVYSLIGPGSIALGAHNTASDSFAIAMGFYNTASGKSSLSLGKGTTASGDYATAIGYHTIASGEFSYAQGSQSTASGKYSTVIGRKVSTNLKQGSIIIGDSDPGNQGHIYVGLEDKFLARFANGYEFRTSTGGVKWIGVKVLPGGNAWESISDRRTKENFEVMDDLLVLNKIASLDYTSWNYIGQDATHQRHYGIMAQEFHGLFGRDDYGTIGNDVTVNPIDMIGVAMSAIKGSSIKIDSNAAVLNNVLENNKTLQESIDLIIEENQKLKNDIDNLKQRITQLELLDER